MFSKSCEYAIKAIIYVAQHAKDEKRVSVKDIAKGTDSPEHFIAKIMQELSRKRLVLSLKGPTGGFFMTEKELQNSLSDIVRAMDGDGMYVDCVLGLKTCSEKTPCPVHHEYKSIKSKLIHMLEKNTIDHFKDKLDTGKFFLKNI